MELHPVDILISIINIIVLFVLLRLILFKPVSKMLSERAAKVKADLDNAHKTREEADSLKQEYSKELENIESMRLDMMRENRASASKEAEEILSESREKANLMIEEARVRIADEKERAVENAKLDAIRIATDMAAFVLNREISDEDNINLVEDFFGETR